MSSGPRRPGDSQASTSSPSPKIAKQVVAALLLREDEVLCCQRTEHQSMPLKWEFPGGKIEPGETPEEALRRELEEELGIEAEIGDKAAHVNHLYGNGLAVALHFFKVWRYEGTLENRIFRDIRWTRRSELSQLDFLDADREIIRALSSGELA